MSFICNASTSGHRRNPDFSRQHVSGFSRNRNRSNEDKDNSENLDEFEFLSTKNGHLLPLSNSPKSHATAAPGPREWEIVELFRKVQAQLRQRAAVKEEKKFETHKGQTKESETVDSLLKFLRKHSVEQEVELEQEKEGVEEGEREVVVMDADFVNEPAVDTLLDTNCLDAEEDDDSDKKDSKTEHTELKDLNTLKLSELRAIAKARGMKGFSKLKKSELAGLLSEVSIYD